MTTDFSNSVCIVYPVEWPKTFRPPLLAELHSTIIFLGDADDELDGITKQDLLTVLSDLNACHYQWVDTDTVKHFGANYDIPVVTLRPTTFMLQMREAVEENLAQIGVHSASEFPYHAHVTIDENTAVPGRLLLGPAQLWYRDERDPIGHC